MKKEYAFSEVAKIDRVAANDKERRLFPYVGLDDIAPESGRFAEEFRRKPETMLAAKFRFTPKHVLYGKLRPYLNKVALPNFDGVCTTEILPLLPDEKIVDREYLYALLLAPKFVHWASANVSGANLPRIAPERLSEYRLELPPLDDQRRIAGQLARADRLRRTHRYALELTDTVLSAAFLELFGDPVKNPYGFHYVELEDDLESIDSGYSPVCEGPRQSVNQWAILGLGAVTTGIFKPDENKRLPDDVPPRPELEVHDGDVLVTRKNTYDLVAACAFVRSPPSRLLLPDTIFRFRLKRTSELSPVFLWGLLAYPSFRKRVQGLASGSAGSMPGISKKKFMSVNCPVPPLALQEKFARLVSTFGRLRLQQSEAHRQAEHLFQTLLQRAFAENC